MQTILNCYHTCMAEIQHRRAAIENCMLAIQDWCASRRLQLNPDKTGSAQGLIWPSCIRMTCVSDLEQSSLTRLRQYGTMVCYWTVSWPCGHILPERHQHVFSTSVGCVNFVDLQINLPCSVLVSAFVIARLDYCNSVMTGLSASSLVPLNSVFSAAVRLVAGLGPRDHVTEHMKRLHWLPIQFGLNSNYVFSCMMRCMVKVLLPSRMFFYHSVIYQVTLVFDLLLQDNTMCLSLEHSLVVEHCP